MKGKDTEAGPQVVLHEVNDTVTDIEDEIKKILALSDFSKSDNRKVELLIDGGVFARMLTANP